MPSEYPKCISKRLVFHVLDAACLLTLQVIQGSVLNYYLISHYKTTINPYFWFIADFACLFVFTGTLTISYQYLTKVRFNPNHGSTNSFYLSPKRIHKGFPTGKLGILPLSYFSWLFYSTIHLTKVVLIFKSGIPKHLKSDEMFGPQLLQVTIAVSGLLFLLLVEGHNWAPRGSPRYLYVTSVCGKTGIEILDTVSLLAFLLVKDTPTSLTIENAQTYLDDVILTLCSFNFFLPALALYKLSLSDVTCENLFLPLNILYYLLHLCMIDVPFLVVRLYLWIAFNHNGSIFIMKNVFGIILALRSIYPDLVEISNRRQHPNQPRTASSDGYMMPLPESIHEDDEHVESNAGDSIRMESNRNATRRADAVLV